MINRSAAASPPSRTWAAGDEFSIGDTVAPENAGYANRDLGELAAKPGNIAELAAMEVGDLIAILRLMTDPVADGLARVLVKAVRQLGSVGHAQAASRLAAEAYVLARRSEPRIASRLDGVMHHLARLEAAAPVPHPGAHRRRDRRPRPPGGRPAPLRGAADPRLRSHPAG